MSTAKVSTIMSMGPTMNRKHKKILQRCSRDVSDTLHNNVVNKTRNRLRRKLGKRDISCDVADPKDLADRLIGRHKPSNPLIIP